MEHIVWEEGGELEVGRDLRYPGFVCHRHLVPSERNLGLGEDVIELRSG